MPKRLARYFVCSIILASTCLPAFAITGNTLADLCQRDAVFCLGYVRGVLDAQTDVMAVFRLFDQIMAERGIDISQIWVSRDWQDCLPSNLEPSQAADVVTKYLRDNPAQRHVSAAALVMLALSTAFPCQQLVVPSTK